MMADLSLDDINTAIAALVASPQVDYKMGDKTVKAGQKMTQLLQLRKAAMDNHVDDINIIAFDALDINDFGTDNTQTIKLV